MSKSQLIPWKPCPDSIPELEVLEKLAGAKFLYLYTCGQCKGEWYFVADRPSQWHEQYPCSCRNTHKYAWRVTVEAL